MRLHEVVLVAVVLSVTTTACSRLTFIKPKAGRGDYEQATPDYSFPKERSGKGPTAARDHIVLAEQKLRAGQLDAAEAEAKAALKAAPNADAYTMLAVIEDQRGRSAQAGGYYAKAAELAPTSGSVLNNYGAWLCGNGRATESLYWFDRALTDASYASSASGRANAGACALSLGQTARADRDLRAALATDPVNPVALASLAELEYRAGRFMEARAFSERRLAAAPASPQVLQLASQIEEKLGDRTAAARYVQRLRTEFPQARIAQPGESSQP